MEKQKHILIVGSGSAGKRHAKNLADLGCKISAMDPREDRLAEIKEQVTIEHAQQDLAKILEEGSFDGAVIASPPVFHIDQAILCAEKNIPLLLEINPS